MVGADDGGAALVHVEPLDVSTLPDVPGATTCKAEVPLPNNTLFAVRDVAPVPPLATATVPFTLAALPPIERLEAVPVKPVPAPVNDVDDKTPVLGLNCSFVDETFSVVMLPVVALVNVRYRVALVVVSSTIETPDASLDHVGTPEASFKTCPSVPAAKNVVVFAPD